MRKTKRTSALTLPNDWVSRMIGDVAARVTEKNSTGNKNVLTISAELGLVSQEEYFNRRVASANTSTYYLMHRGDFAYNKSYSAGYPVGVIRRLDGYDAGIVSPLYICFRPSPSVNSDFLRHFFSSGILDDDLSWIAKEGVRNHGLLNVGVDDFFSLPIMLPPYFEQQRIAEILNSVDESIRTTERLISKLLISKQGMTHDLLVNRSNSSWQTTRLSDVCLIESGQTPSRSVPKFWKDGTIAWVKTGEINFSPIDRTEEYISSFAATALGMKVHAPQTILIAMYGQGATRGRVGILRIPATTNQACAALTCTSTSLLPEFLFEYMSAHYEVLRKLGHGSQQTNLSTGILAAHQIAIPSLDEQESILRQIAQNANAIAVQRAELSKLRELKRGLMDDLLTGRVRVNTGEGVAA